MSYYTDRVVAYEAWQRERAETAMQLGEEAAAKAAYDALAAEAVPDGPDLSSANTITNWTTLAANVGFAFLKVADGDIRQGTDGSLFQSRVAAAKAAGIPWLPYQFGRVAAPSNGERNGRVEAAMAIYFAWDGGWGRPGDLPLAYDLEGESLNGQDPVKCAKHVIQFINEYTFTMQHRPVVYTNPSTWMQVLPQLDATQKEIVAECPLWLADWTPPADVPPPWVDWTFWQWTSTGSLLGISGAVDLNHFSGNATELEALRIS